MVGPMNGSTPSALPEKYPNPSVSLLMDAPPDAGISMPYMPLVLKSVQS